MPKEITYTPEMVLDAAITVVREKGFDSLTVRAVAKALGASTQPVFKCYKSMDALCEKVLERIREIYNGYADKGFGMTPAGKGFGIQYVRFAIDEPNMFRALFMSKDESRLTIKDFMKNEGHYDKIVEIMSKNYNVPKEIAESIYQYGCVYAHGLASMCACGSCSFTEEELSEMMGISMRGHIMAIRAGRDPREKIIPNENVELKGSFDDFINGVNN